jgi:hypothetical protein
MSENAERVLPSEPMPTLVHCAYHKCLTVYVDRCFNRLLGDNFQNFFSDQAAFYARHHLVALSATSDFVPDVSRLGDYRISRFIRDPRDLVVSGYFYHRRGGEEWTLQTPDKWTWVGNIPKGMRSDESFSEHLQRLDQEDGLIAEIELRMHDFKTMVQWPTDDPAIKTWKYEDIIGHEVEIMDQVGEHYGWPEDTEPFSLRQDLRRWAERWRAKQTNEWETHVRDPRPGQWRKVFTPKVQAAFERMCGDLPTLLGYEAW